METYKNLSKQDDEEPLAIRVLNQETGMRTAEAAERELLKMLVASPLLRSAFSKNEMPSCHISEIQVGQRLGCGACCAVYEIHGFSKNRGQKIVKDSSPVVLKQMKWGLVDDSLAYKAAGVGLACEALILQSLDHPNILRIRGVSAGGTDGYRSGKHNGFFVVLDRLDESLDERIHAWRAELRRLKKRPWPWHERKRRQQLRCLMVERLKMFREIASALEYLHDNKIIHRDVKTDNVGFFRGKVQLFDFGLARALGVPDDPENGTYDLTKAGSPRYLAPEVERGDFYNEKADVFGAGVIFWEMLTASRTNGGDLSPCPCWPSSVQSLLRNMLAKDAASRPSMKQVMQAITSEISSSSTVLKVDGLIQKATSQEHDDPTESIRESGHFSETL